MQACLEILSELLKIQVFRSVTFFFIESSTTFKAGAVLNQGEKIPGTKNKKRRLRLLNKNSKIQFFKLNPAFVCHDITLCRLDFDRSLISSVSCGSLNFMGVQ